MNTAYLLIPNDFDMDAQSDTIEKLGDLLCERYRIRRANNLSELQVQLSADEEKGGEYESASADCGDASPDQTLFVLFAPTPKALLDRLSGLRARAGGDCPVLGVLPSSWTPTEDVASDERWSWDEVPRFFDIIRAPINRFEVLSRLSSLEDLARNYRESLISGYTDNQTRLYNYAYFLEATTNELAKGKRHGFPAAVVVLRLDYYHVYLDSYGYDATTRLLQQLGAVLRRQVRNEDTVARLSEDEMAVLLPQSDEKGARIVMERLMDAVACEYFEIAGQPENVRLRMGIAASNTPGYIDEADTYSGDALIRYARHALHQTSLDTRIEIFSDIRPVLSEIED